MSRSRLLIIVLLSTSACLTAAPPDWVVNYGTSQRHNKALYLTGFGIAVYDRKTGETNCTQQASRNATTDLIEKVFVSIRTEVTSIKAETDTDLTNYFSVASQASSHLDVSGLETDKYWDNKAKTAYAFAYVPRRKLYDLYRGKNSTLEQAIRQHVSTGAEYENAGRRTDALTEYLECFPLLTEYEENKAIMMGIRSSITEMFEELEGEKTPDLISISDLRKIVDQTITEQPKSLEDVAWRLAYLLGTQVDTQRLKLLITPFMYRDTQMGSQFSRYMQRVLQSKCAEVNDWSAHYTSGGFSGESADVSIGVLKGSGAEYILSGTYWEMQDFTKIYAAIRRIDDGKVIASAEVVAPDNLIDQNQFSLKPQNYLTALQDQKVFQKDDVLGGGLMLDAWTNRGVNNLLFNENDTMQVFIRVNMRCYIRFIYHLADGTRTLLLNSLYIDESKVNHVYEIPPGFITTAPFGVEVLQVFAKTTEFEPVNTQPVGGYDILEEDLQVVMNKTRGMMMLTLEKPLQAEKRLIITTLP